MSSEKEVWALLIQPERFYRELSVQRVRSLSKTRMTWKTAYGRHWVDRSRVVGFFPTFELADDARNAARYAYIRAIEARESGLIWAKSAVKESPGYQELPR